MNCNIKQIQFFSGHKKGANNKFTYFRALVGETYFQRCFGLCINSL